MPTSLESLDRVLPEPTAEERLALSRERIRAAMHRRSSPRGPGQPKGAPPLAWLEPLKTIPGADIVVEAIRGWWFNHPLRAAAIVGSEAVTTIARPMAQTHPVALVVIALIAGGVLTRVKPWRWAVVPALFAGFLPQVMSRTLSQIPIQSWLDMITTFARRDAPAGATASDVPSQPAPVQPM